jgi:hypothetical protein
LIRLDHFSFLFSLWALLLTYFVAAERWPKGIAKQMSGARPRRWDNERSSFSFPVLAYLRREKPLSTMNIHASCWPIALIKDQDPATWTCTRSRLRFDALFPLPPSWMSICMHDTSVWYKLHWRESAAMGCDALDPVGTEKASERRISSSSRRRSSQGTYKEPRFSSRLDSAPTTREPPNPQNNRQEPRKRATRCLFGVHDRHPLGSVSTATSNMKHAQRRTATLAYKARDICG